jgi:hypothetical protein
MVVSGQSRLSPKGLRAFYLCLTGVAVLSFAVVHGTGFFRNGNEELIGRMRMLMLGSWWMVLSGIVTYGSAYMLVAFLLALGQGVAQPLKPTRRLVFAFALLFGLIHSFRLAYGGNLPFDFIVIFTKDLFGILLALAATSTGPLKEMMYRRENKGSSNGALSSGLLKG